MATLAERLNASEAILRAGNPRGAATILEELLRENPTWAQAHHAMAMVQVSLGRWPEALESATRATAEQPQWGDAWLTRGIVQLCLGHATEGIVDLRRAVALSPELERARLLLAKALTSQKQCREAVEICRRLWSDRRDGPDARELTAVYCNATSMLGDLDHLWPVLALAASERPDDTELLSTLSSAANSSSTASAKEILEFHERYGRAVERRRPSVSAAFTNPADPDRPLRIGIVSYDFAGDNSVSFFMAPLFLYLDQTRCAIHAYSVGVEFDTTSRAFQGRCAAWRHVPRADDDALAAHVRADGIDIVVEMIGHTGRRSLGAFWPRCAPVQVAYLAYSNTTGLRSFDWRIVDSVTDPSPEADALATERLWRLDPCFVCYCPPGRLPPVAETPAAHSGVVTFGSFGELLKFNDAMLGTWAGALAGVPGSRLVLKNRAPQTPDAEAFLRQRLSRAGIAMDRVILLPRTATFTEHLAHFARVDVMLDTWPYNGTTSVCESLVMGVPMIGMRPAAFHDRHAARVTMSLLAAAGLPELVARDPEDFAEIARRLAGDIPALSAMRSGLRDRFLASAVCDGRAFADRFGKALREMWREYCLRGSSGVSR